MSSPPPKEDIPSKETKPPDIDSSFDVSSLPPELLVALDQPGCSNIDSLSELLAQYFGHKGREIQTKFSFDETGNVSSSARGQPQFFAGCGKVKRVKITCDTGAEQSFISWDALVRSQGATSREQVKFWPTKNTAIDASGNRMVFLGFALIQLELQGKKTSPIPVYIVPTQSFQILLGQNWLKESVEADLMLSQNLIIFNKGPWEGCVSELCYRGESISLTPGLYLVKKTKLPARTQIYVECRPSRILSGPNIVAEANQPFPGVRLPRSLVRNKSAVYLALVNTNFYPVFLSRSTRIASALCCPEEAGYEVREKEKNR